MKELTKNQIKKIIYKSNPVAKFSYIRDISGDCIAHYNSTLDIPKDGDDLLYTKVVEFEIPCKDMGGSDFEDIMVAKHTDIGSFGYSGVAGTPGVPGMNVTEEIEKLTKVVGVKVVLDSIPIEEIEKYLRRKKLDNIKKIKL